MLEKNSKRFSILCDGLCSWRHQSPNLYTTRQENHQNITIHPKTTELCYTTKTAQAPVYWATKYRTTYITRTITTISTRTDTSLVVFTSRILQTCLPTRPGFNSPRDTTIG